MATTIKGRNNPKPFQQQKNKIIASLDVGTTKVSCFIAKLNHSNDIEIIGIGHHASKGLKSGAIVDLKAAENAIGQAIQAAENMASLHMNGQALSSIYVNAPGTCTLSHQISVDVKISGHEITEKDIKTAMAQAKSVEVHGKDELIHVIPANFSIDGRHGIAEPRGMFGQNLSVDMNAVTAISSTLRNNEMAIGKNHLDIQGYCSAPYASGLACLVDDERELGCTVIDMGGSTTSMAVFFEGKMIYTSAIGVGGLHVTNDIARGLTTSISDAERIKVLYGAAMTSSADDSDIIDVPTIGESFHNQSNHIPRSILTGIIQPRIEETFELVRAKLEDTGLSQVAGRRVVLTGGASQMPGLCELGQLILDKKIRVGQPMNIKGMAESTGGPSFSANIGLLIYAAQHAAEQQPETHTNTMPMVIPINLIEKVSHWLKENW